VETQYFFARKTGRQTTTTTVNYLHSTKRKKRKIQKNPTFRYFFFRRLLISVGWLVG